MHLKLLILYFNTFFQNNATYLIEEIPSISFVIIFYIQVIILAHAATGSTRLNNPGSNLDLREEYANAFRTESYNDFWTRVVALKDDVPSSKTMTSSTTAARLPSYRLFAEYLLEPDQPTVVRTLTLTQKRPENHTLLSDYFSQTANASILCGVLLKDIDRTRRKYRSLKTTLKLFENGSCPCPPVLTTRLSVFYKSPNPFVSSASSPRRFEAVQLGCFSLLKRLEKSRDKARSKLRLMNKMNHGSAICLVALTVSLTVIVMVHALAVLVAAPGLVVASLDFISSKKLVKYSAQLDSAAKGTYILCRDLDTISHLVTRLNDELEHMRSTVKFWLKRGEDRLQARQEIARQLKKNDSAFSQQLDELEEHLYLCFMTINRARKSVMKQITDPGQPEYN